MLKHGILGLLNYGSMSGYQIMELFRDSLSYFWSANTSQIYRELQVLKEKGFVTDQTIPQQGKPDKKLFSITEKGKEELRAWLQAPGYGNANSGLLMKVFFAGELPPEANVQRFRQIKAEAEDALRRYRLVSAAADGYQAALGAPEKSVYWNMTLDFGIRYAQMLRDWSDRCIAKLEAET
ncbi:MAG: PadR family transcriptional regulator [Faecousia sp.]